MPRSDDMDPPRKRRKRDEDDEDEDRPSSRRRDDDEDEEDDRPRKRKRDDEPKPRPRKRRSSGVGAWSLGKGFGVMIGVFVGCGLLGVGVVAATRGGVSLSSLSPFGADISYEKYKAINRNDTLEGLEKKFGKPEKIEKADWGKTKMRVGPEMERDVGTLGDYTRGTGIEAWYRWRSGPEDVYVAVGKDENNKTRLIAKGYTNTKAMERNRGQDPNNFDFSKIIPGYIFEPVQ